MTEQLITFDTAKLAKEKGFDWQTNMVYKQELLYTRDNIIKNSAFKNSKVYRATAPTQSLLQKWLREVHNIHVVALPWKDHCDDANDPVKYRGMIFRVKTYEEHLQQEDAMEKVLFEALKLIK